MQVVPDSGQERPMLQNSVDCPFLVRLNETIENGHQSRVVSATRTDRGLHQRANLHQGSRLPSEDKALERQKKMAVLLEVRLPSEQRIHQEKKKNLRAYDLRQGSHHSR